MLTTRRPHLKTASWLISFGFLLVAPCLARAAATDAIASPPGTLSIVWTASQPTSVIQTFTEADLKKLKKKSSTEADPATGKKASFEGVLLSDLVDRALEGTTNDRKAQIDLVVVKNAQGASALIPRSFIVKYPMLLAWQENHKDMGALRSIVPWSTHPKTRTEGLPLDTYFLKGVTQIELANYHERYANVFLKRRTDPLAMRGEKLFVQDCMACHNSVSEISKARNWSGTHPGIAGAPKLDSRDTRSLHSYLDVFRAESSPQNGVAATGVSRDEK